MNAPSSHVPANFGSTLKLNGLSENLNTTPQRQLCDDGNNKQSCNTKRTRSTERSARKAPCVSITIRILHVSTSSSQPSNATLMEESSACAARTMTSEERISQSHAVRVVFTAGMYPSATLKHFFARSCLAICVFPTWKTSPSRSIACFFFEKALYILQYRGLLCLPGCCSLKIISNSADETLVKPKMGGTLIRCMGHSRLAVLSSQTSPRSLKIARKTGPEL